MGELKTEPGWKPAPREPTASRKPWWAVALLTGLGAGAAIAASLGFAGPPARSEPKIAAATVSPVQASEGDAWRVRMEQKLDFALREIADTREKLARIEGRLERK